jgi:surface protein
MQLPTIIATDDTIHKIVKDEIAKYGYNANLNHIDVSKVTDMRGFFKESSFNGDISQWDVSNVTNMRAMFSNSRFNGDISKWNVSNVTNLEYMFEQSLFNGGISQWDVSNVTNMEGMFYSSPFNGDISQWDVYNVINMNVMFAHSKFNSDISEWDVSNVIEMWYMFDNSSFNGDVSKWSIHPDCNIKGVLTQHEFILPPLLKMDDAEAYTLRLREALNATDAKPLEITSSISTRHPNPTAAHAVYLLLSSSKPQTIHPQFRASDRKKLQMLYQLTGSVYQSVVAWEQQHKLKTSPSTDSANILTLMEHH